MLKTVSTQLALASDTLPEVLAKGNTTGGTDLAVSAGDDITLADNSKVIFGAGSDLSIYSDGTTGQVTGSVNVTGSATFSAGIAATTGTFSGEFQNTGDFSNVTAAATANAAIFGAIAGLSNGYRIASDTSNNLTYTWSDGAGNTDMTLDASGNLSLATGNVVLASGSGIDFSATAGTGTSELFDDYEEGEWTPTVTTGTVTGSGNYTKIGDLVTVRGALSSFSDRTTAANIIVGGLPFSSTLFQSGGSAFGRYVSIPASTAVVGSTSKINFYEMASGNYGVLQHSNLTSSSSAVYFEATYLSS